MGRTIILLAAVFAIIFNSNADRSDAILKTAKKEARFLGRAYQPRKKSDADKYVRIEHANGKQFVDRGAIALDLFEDAANSGNGEAAFILFCYYCIGRYENRNIFSMDWELYEKGSEESKAHWNYSFNKGLTFLGQAYTLNYPYATEFLFWKSNYANDKQRLCYIFNTLYDAIQGDPLQQLAMAYEYRGINNTGKYEYWIKKSINQKKWPLAARTDYANYLLDLSRREEAYSIIQPAEKKTDYTTDITANLALGYLSLFYIADRLYTGNTSDAIKICERIYDDNRSFNYYAPNKHDLDLVEYFINYYTNKERKKLYETIYSYNKTVSDSLLLYNRGVCYEIWGDSITAFDYFKSAALKKNADAILKTFDYSSKGYELSNETIASLLPEIIKVEYDNGDFTIHGKYANWRMYYILGEFYYYNSKHRDYKKAFRLYYACVNEYCPNPVKGKCAMQLFRCYEMGRGTTTDSEKADQWLKVASEMGDSDADVIHDAIYPSGQQIK